MADSVTIAQANAAAIIGATLPRVESVTHSTWTSIDLIKKRPCTNPASRLALAPTPRTAYLPIHPSRPPTHPVGHASFLASALLSS